jgi:hypothetical protein
VYLLFGEAGSNDAVRLFKVVAGVHTEILTGPIAQIASSFTMGVRVVRDNLGNWSLYLDDTGGTNYALAGSVNDGTIVLGTHFGVYDVYTMSNSTKFYYDNFYVGDEILDTDPPILTSATAISANQVDVFFDEAIDQTSGELIANYSISSGIVIGSIQQDGSNPALSHLTLSNSLTNGQTYDLTTNQIEDLSGNISGSQVEQFSYLIGETPVAGDVVINEFMCDPSPVVGLPELEFVEVYNRSAKIFDVSNWTLGDASSNGTIQQEWLLPGEYLVLTSTSNVDSFTVSVGVTSFPSLNNGGDNIVLRSDVGTLLDSLSYSDDWYQDPNKESGGYSLERINPNDPCTDYTDWRASNNSSGGTPGTANSILDLTPDTQSPQIDQLIALAPNFLEVYFTEGMDSLSLVSSTLSTNPPLTVQNVYALSTYPSMMTIQFVENFALSQEYEIELQNVGDCWMNTTTLNGVFALPETAEPGDVVINEIMFNPVTGGSDWVELYNNSDKLIDLYQWELANMDDDTISNHQMINQHFLLYPNAYAVVSEDTLHIVQQYSSAVPGNFIQSDLPTYSNEEGTVYAIAGGQVVDHVTYSDEWHFQLLDDDDGKSLERIDPDGESNSGDNWHTAAEAIGFATPGRVNSQLSPVKVEGDFSFNSEVISPDNDGFEDVLQVSYVMNEPGHIGTFKIYDDRGREIATVIDSELLGSEGTFIWDGVTADGNKASIGVYVGIFETRHPNGGIFMQRKAFTVAGKL